MLARRSWHHCASGNARSTHACTYERKKYTRELTVMISFEFESIEVAKRAHSQPQNRHRLQSMKCTFRKAQTLAFAVRVHKLVHDDNILTVTSITASAAGLRSPPSLVMGVSTHPPHAALSAQTPCARHPCGSVYHRGHTAHTSLCQTPTGPSSTPLTAAEG